MGVLTVGFPEDTVETIERTIEFALSCDFDRIQVSAFTPYPGSVLFNQLFRAEERNEYEHLVMSYLTDGTIPRINPILDNNQIHLFQNKFIKKYYLRPKVILSLLRQLRFSQVVAMSRHPLITRWFSRKESVWTSDVS